MQIEEHSVLKKKVMHFRQNISKYDTMDQSVLQHTITQKLVSQQLFSKPNWT